MDILPVFSQPSYEVHSSHKKLNSLLHDRITSLQIIDTLNQEVDQLSIIFDNRSISNNIFIPTPEMGKELYLKLGYVSYLKDFGNFYIDSWNITTPPSLLNVTATSINLTQDLFNQKNKVWKSKNIEKKLTVYEVVSEIAEKHQFTPVISSSYTKKIIQDYQYIESDMQFLSRTAKKYNAFLKIRNKKLIFQDYEELENNKNRLINTVNLPSHKMTHIRFEQQELVHYQSVQAYWYNYDQSTYFLEEYPSTLLSSGPLTTLNPKKVFMIRDVFTLQDTAKIAVKSKFDSLIRSKKLLQLNCIGNPELATGKNLVIKDVQKEINGHWIIQRITHSFDKSGFTTQVDAYQYT